MQFIYFCFLYSIIWLREGRIHTLNDNGYLTIDHGVIMEKSKEFDFVFSVGTLSDKAGIHNNHYITVFPFFFAIFSFSFLYLYRQ